jgi:hypothetical protein
MPHFARSGGSIEKIEEVIIKCIPASNSQDHNNQDSQPTKSNDIRNPTISQARKSN